MSRDTALTRQQQPQSMVQSEQRPVVTPPCDVFESRDEILLLADLPGVVADALRINVDNGELVVEARRVVPAPGTVLGAEFEACEYQRRFAVPPGIDSTKIAAELKNGVLALHLPKSEALKPRQIAVKAG